MEICIFAITYFLTNIVKILNLSEIIYIGIAILFVAILVYNDKIVFKTMLLGMTLSTIIFNFHEKMEKEYDLIGTQQIFQAIVLETEEKFDDFSSVIVYASADGKRFKSKVYIENDDDILKPADTIYGYAYISKASYSSGFDRENYYKSENINVLMSASGDFVIERCEKFNIIRFFSDIREGIVSKLEQNFDYDTSSFIKALVLGDKSGFSEYFSIDISKVGISHILAVSGMHIGFLASLCMLIFGKKHGFWITTVFITAFLFIVGVSPSILRAVIMQYMIIIAWYLNYEYDSKKSIWVAFTIILMIEPYIIFSAGFVLSFLSAISIIYLYNPIYQAIKCKNNTINKFVMSSIAVSICVTTTTTFALFYYFGYISTVMVISNIIIIPIIAILFPLCIIYCIVSFLNPFILLPLKIAIEGLVFIIYKIIENIVNFRYAINSTDITQIVILSILITVCIASFVINKYKKQVILTSVIIFLFSGVYSSYKSYDDFKINIFSVGDGQCILVTYKNEVTLIDCASSEYYNASKLVNEYLYKYSYDKIDNLIITSIDNTHIEDINSLEFEVSNIIYPENYVRAESNEILTKFLESNDVKINDRLPDYIEVYDVVDKKLVVKVADFLILHSLTNLMIEQFTENSDITAKNIILADKTIQDYRRLESSLGELSAEFVILSNDYDMLSRVSGYPAKTTAEHGDILINLGDYYGKK